MDPRVWTGSPGANGIRTLPKEGVGKGDGDIGYFGYSR